MRACERGFTLIEVVVALAILGLSLGVLYQSFGWSTRRTSALIQTEAAWLTAQSLLAEIRVRPMLDPGDEEGELPNGLRWRTHIGRYESAIGSSYSLQPFAVTIELQWGERTSQRLQLHSVELSRVRT